MTNSMPLEQNPEGVIKRFVWIYYTRA